MNSWIKRLSVFTLIIISVLEVSAQSLYDSTAIQRIDISFNQTNWDYMLDTAKAGNESYIMAESVSINGVSFDSVGVKYKGNSTYNANQVKNPWHIELDTYKEQDYQGYKDIKLSNVKNDPSFVREVLSYEIARKYMKAPLSNYAVVYVNGTQMGLYTNSEAVSKRYVNTHLGSKSNTFVKCNPPAGAGPGTNNYPNLVYQGTDSSLYYSAYEMKSDYGWAELIAFTDTLANNVAQIENILNVDQALWMHAFNNALVNLDSYSGGFSQNYYLYRQNNGQFYPIVWDMNESIGRFSMTGSTNLTSTTSKSQMTAFLHENDGAWPLISKLLDVPMYKRMYLAHLKTIVTENLDNGQYFTSAQYYQNLIDSAVAADPNNLSNYSDFTSNLTSDVSSSGGGPGGGGPGGGSTPGIQALLDARATYLMSINEFTAIQPAITNVQAIAPSGSSSMALFTAHVSNAQTVYLSVRSVNEAFAHYQMFDDGQHGDGAASDGVYGVSISMPMTSMDYYIYADGNSIGAFSPARAGHEYHSLVRSVNSNTLVINELMASNDATIAATDGEFYDWVELYNASNSAIYLGDYSLSDDLSDPLKYILPSDSLASGDFVLIWASDTALQNPYHAPYKLSKSGEELALFYDPWGVLDTVDLVVFGAQSTDISYGRSYDASSSWVFFNTPTPNASNGTMGLPQREEIGIKVYPNPHNGSFKVYNPTSFNVSFDLYGLQGQLIQKLELAPESTTSVDLGLKNQIVIGHYHHAELHGYVRLICIR